jgi:hypothetical protein
MTKHKFVIKEGPSFKNSFGEGFIVPNWKEGEEKGVLKAGDYGELGRSGLYTVYRRPAMYFAENKEEAEKLSKKFKEEDKLFRKYEKQLERKRKKLVKV